MIGRIQFAGQAAQVNQQPKAPARINQLGQVDDGSPLNFVDRYIVSNIKDTPERKETEKVIDAITGDLALSLKLMNGLERARKKYIHMIRPNDDIS